MNGLRLTHRAHFVTEINDICCKDDKYLFTTKLKNLGLGLLHALAQMQTEVIGTEMCMLTHVVCRNMQMCMLYADI